MSNNRKYYYLKLKDNFFDSEEIIILQNMQDGYLYSDILFKMYLRSLKNEGKLMFNDYIPYDSRILSQIVRHSVGVVEKAISVFKQLGMIEIMDDGAIYMLHIQNYIGHSSTEADRQREYQERIKIGKQLPCKKSNKESNKKTTPERERELKKEKEIDKDRFTPPAHEEVSAYINEMGYLITADEFIDCYSVRGWIIGKTKEKMKDWKAAVRNYVKNDKAWHPEKYMKEKSIYPEL